MSNENKVVLPEPDDIYRGTCADGTRCLHGCHKNDPCHTVRALLATATGLPAQAVPAFCNVAYLKLKSLQERGYQITGYALEKPVEGAQPERGFINHGGFVGWWWDGQSPQAQADARDAERWREATRNTEITEIGVAVFDNDGDYRVVTGEAADSAIDAAIAIAAAKGED